ncbi:tyrosinase family protein [Streptomyces sp. TLI_185]|uniref:tyrosinase family protein n=1 Tax=Streptomyces sp. TLI_185 TaxID=2485151 RepID=UPI000FC07643|nr:tyrosinase family protein [Streptomyces sp. TLI_185]RPF31751.1 common central domain of tyrosinase [Streptomyces sp. TLI_185]
MALGDGIRRNLLDVPDSERQLLRDAIAALNSHFYPGSKTDLPVPGGVSFWFKQDEIHQSTHVHNCPAFLPWHREIVNRFEDLIRDVNSQLSLHYWDWTKDPAPLFTPEFMGSANGLAGQFWRDSGFYNPDTAEDRDTTLNPADPPKEIIRQVGVSAPLVLPREDRAALGAPDFPEFNRLINILHAAMHSYIGGPGGTLTDPHQSFRDPFVFLLHSNVDRLFAMWQRDPAHPERLDPARVYGAWGNTTGSGDVTSEHPKWGILSPLEPWSGPDAQTSATGVITNVVKTRPWCAPEKLASFKDSLDPSIVTPRSYDTALAP